MSSWRLRRCVAVAGALFVELATAAAAEDPDLIPREVLFSDPAYESPQISPDGSKLAFLIRSAEGALNINLRDLASGRDSLLTHDRQRGIPGFTWAPDGSHILYFKDSDGDENNHLYSIDLATGVARDLTPFVGIAAQDLHTDPAHPGAALVSLNLEDRSLFDVYRCDLATGAVALDTKNPGGVIAWTVDRSFQVRAATALDPETADTILLIRDGPGEPWRKLAVWRFEEAGIDFYQRIIAFTRDDSALLVQQPTGGNTTRLALLDAATGKEIETLASDPRCDIWNIGGVGLVEDAVVLLSPSSGDAQAVAFHYMEPEWRVLDAPLREDFDRLSKAHPGFPMVVNRDEADRTWVVGYLRSDAPMSYYLYHRKRPAEEDRLEHLFSTYPSFGDLAFAPMEPVIIEARDGMPLVSYLTRPPGTKEWPAPGPMILLVHGGPWYRDLYGFDPWVQLLANRGYAVLQVNFRGSAGFGNDFLNAGTGQWGVGSMQHDLTDAVEWAVRERIVDPEKIGIMGASYGGYATLAGLAFTPDRYACGVDLVGVSDVKTVIESFPPYWAPKRRRWILRIGDVIGDDALNRRISPLYHAGAIRAPLLIAQGANDPRVHVDQSDRIVAALRANGRDVTYVFYPDEGHGLGREENLMDFTGRAEEFLARILGGRLEPWKEVPGSSAQIR